MKFAAIAIAAIAACGGAKATPTAATPAPTPDAPPAVSMPPRPASVTAEMIATTDRVLAALTQLATDVHGAADCEAAAVAIGADAPAVKAIIPDAARLDQQWSAAGADAQQWFATVYEPRFRANNDAMTEATSSCKDNADFMSAFNSVNGH